MATTTFTPPNPEIGMAEFQAAQADCLNVVASYAGDEVVRVLLHHPEGQSDGEYAPTAEHALRVAALMDIATRDFVSGQGRTRLVVAGFFHDVAKLLVPEINAVVHNGRTLTDAERLLVNSHAQLGGDWVTNRLADTLDPALLPGIVHDIANHHTDTPERKPDSGFVHALQTADQVDAMLLDWTREYKIKRFTKDGFLDENGQPNPEAIIMHIMHNKPARIFGIPTRRIVETAVPLMPAYMAAAGIGSTLQ